MQPTTADRDRRTDEPRRAEAPARAYARRIDCAEARGSGAAPVSGARGGALREPDGWERSRMAHRG